jgi:hypothetical protein
MIKITPEDLVQYLYKETPPQKTMAIKAALESDWCLLEAFEQIVATQNQLHEFEHSPREEAVKRIVDHADKMISHMHSH